MTMMLFDFIKYIVIVKYYNTTSGVSENFCVDVTLSLENHSNAPIPILPSEVGLVMGFSASKI